MRIAHIVLPGASEYERKLQRVDFAALTGSHDVTVAEVVEQANAAAVAHVYGPPAIPARALSGLRIPYLASFDVRATRFTFRPVEPPRYILSPLPQGGGDPRHQQVPEAVEEKWFSAAAAGLASSDDRIRVIGSFGGGRAGIASAVEEALARIHRFRDDIRWTVLDRPPSPADLAGVDAWVDPAAAEEDWDGFVAEGIAAGKAVVATRIAINSQRLEQGRTGFLVPPRDSNELAHAILGALFKPEVARLKIEAAKQTVGKFRPRQRLRVLERIYETLIE